jgi:hypothetical protein
MAREASELERRLNVARCIPSLKQVVVEQLVAEHAVPRQTSRRSPTSDRLERLAEELGLFDPNLTLSLKHKLEDVLASLPHSAGTPACVSYSSSRPSTPTD